MQQTGNTVQGRVCSRLEVAGK